MSERGLDASALHRSETSESESLRQCLSLVNTLEDGIYQLDDSGRFVAVNDAVVELTGYARSELVGEHVSAIVGDEDVSRLEAEIRTRLETGDDRTTTFDIALEAADGSRVMGELRFSLLLEEGTFEGTVGVVRPIQHHDRPHDHLPSIWETYESISSVIDEADVGVFVLDDAFDVVWIDETVEEYFGLDREQVVGRDKRRLIRESIQDLFAEPEAFAETVLATYDDNSYVERFESQITPGPDREGRWLEHRSKPIESGRYAGGRIELYYDVTQRKEAERARREEQRRFETLVDAVEEYAIVMLDPAGAVVSWNSGAERIAGYDASEIIGAHVSTFYTEADRADGVPDRTLAAARAEGTVESEGWRVRADGSRYWANVTVAAIYEDGALQGYAKVTRDSTERREREQRLRREHELTRQILETAPVGIAVVNPDGSTVRANERMAELLTDPTADEPVYTTNRRDVFDADGEFLPVEARPVARAFDTGQAVTDRDLLLAEGDGERRWLSITASPIAGIGGEPKRVVEAATDVTGLKELAERRRRDLEEREKELAGVKLATNLLETGDQPVGKLLREFVSLLPQFFQYPDRTGARVAVGDVAAATDSYEPTANHLETHTETAAGTPITIDVTDRDPPTVDRTRFLDEEAELLDTLATLLKLHFDRHEYVDELEASNARLEQFAYAASHDLREPLRMVSSYLRLIERRYAEEFDAEGEEFLAYAVDGADRMREMIEGLLAYSRIGTQGAAFEPVDLEAVLADVRTDLRVSIEERDATITADPLPTVSGDGNQLRQVFQNLLDNALEYGGEEPPRVHVGAERDGDEWVVSVADEGIGIDPADAERVFEVFQRLHTREEHPGTGIGLALCKRIVDRHGGSIWVETDAGPEAGTTIAFTLPALET